MSIAPATISIETLTRQQRQLLRALMIALALGLMSLAMVSDNAAPPRICKAFTFGESAFGGCDTFGAAPPQPAALF